MLCAMPKAARKAAEWLGCFGSMSQVNVADQAVSFLLSVALGAALGMLYCFFCSVREWGRRGVWQVFWQDMVFWGVCFVATFSFLLVRCRGEVRGFVYIGELLGFGLFRIVLFRLCVKIYLAVFRFLALLCRPFRAVFRCCCGAGATLVDKMGKFGEKWYKKFAKGRKKDLKAE